jgi:hypothetical protein
LHTDLFGRVIAARATASWLRRGRKTPRHLSNDNAIRRRPPAAARGENVDENPLTETLHQSTVDRQANRS